MAVRVRPITLWRAEVNHQPGALAQTLEPLAAAGTDLRAVMGYRLPGDRARAAIEVFPVMGAKALSAAQAAGLSQAGISALLVEGDNRPGLGHALAKALADAGINIGFLIAVASGRSHSTVIGFESGDDANRAMPLIKRASAAPRTAGGKRRGATRRARKAARRRR